MSVETPDSRLVNDLNELREVAGLLGETLVKGRTNAAILAILLEYPCLARCYDEMVSNSYPSIDPFYQERHEFLRRTLVDDLHASLGNRFHEIGVGGEHQTDLSRGDIDLSLSPAGLEVPTGNSRARVEIKGGRGFSIAQVMRHLIDVDVVIICLAGRGDAFAIKKSDVSSLLSELAKIATKKLTEIMMESTDTLSKTPGPWCQGCKVRCAYAKKAHGHTVNFEREFASQVTHWKAAIDKTVTIVSNFVKEDT